MIQDLYRKYYTKKKVPQEDRIFKTKKIVLSEKRVKKSKDKPQKLTDNI